MIDTRRVRNTMTSVLIYTVINAVYTIKHYTMPICKYRVHNMRDDKDYDLCGLVSTAPNTTDGEYFCIPVITVMHYNSFQGPISKKDFSLLKNFHSHYQTGSAA